MDLPDGTFRLFPELPPEDLGSPPGPYVVGRLLEEGDGDDLRWLSRTVDEAVLRAWLEERGGRQLSRRSRAFWVRLLRPGKVSSASGQELWTL